MSTDSLALKDRTTTIGRDLFQAIDRRSGPWSRAWWEDRLMALTMSDPATKVQLFRFIDALPMLTSHQDVRRHLKEYLDEAGGTVPWLVKLPLALAPPGALGDRLIAALARFGANRMARKFIAGASPQELLQTVLGLRKRELAFTADLLGEAVLTSAEADAYQKTCLDLLGHMTPGLNQAPELPRIDRDEHGPLPRMNLSLKLSSLVPLFDALPAEATTAQVLNRLRPILARARSLGAYVHIDMEQYAFKDLSIAIFEQVLIEDAFRDWPDVGIVVQAYLKESRDDLARLRDFARSRGTPITIRLVKGAYWDYEVLHARQVGWPVPVYEHKWRTDANYERCTDDLLDHREWLRPAFGSHNVRSLAHAIAGAERRGVPPNGYELQLLHGMGDAIARALVARGHRVRVYTPYGALLPGMAYLVRRLLENTSNESFLKASSAGALSVDELLSDPEEIGAMWGKARRTQSAAPVNGADALPPFRNEPPTDFSKEPNRAAMRAAIQDFRRSLDAKGPPRVGFAAHADPGSDGAAHATVQNRDPNDLARVIAEVREATREQAETAVSRARSAFRAWSETAPADRAGVLLRTAGLMRRDRFRLAAIEVHECGKPWREADADIAEAIDFCEFYAREMVRLGRPERRDVPGETNRVEHRPRGVAVIIPPWNFPLAIPCGMTVAALVAGNAVILKPAEQAPLIAQQLVNLLEEAGLPSNVLQLLPGRGEEVGQALVNDSRVDLIAFTGSRDVGLLINRQAAAVQPGQDHVKRVIAEMGGKNAIIIDDDADLDEAVAGVLTSAFGYAGQKCSACSRVIVLERVHDAFLERLVEAARALPVGPADDPDTVIGPVIDAEARRRVEDYARIAEAEGRIVLKVDVGPLAERGHYVGPVIVADVQPDARIAQEEVFGPILAVLKAPDLDRALAIANGTNYALTGGLYSRSPAQIEHVERAFVVGNLYINRPITGALVDRQPFGGFKLSGIGTKAGGSDYLKEFLLTRVITENTLRRGFAPEAELATSATALPPPTGEAGP